MLRVIEGHSAAPVLDFGLERHVVVRAAAHQVAADGVRVPRVDIGQDLRPAQRHRYT